ncbi:MAG: hypothetical protein KY461_14385 [Actinobacteria bacterium]|nr:hypothetical protein [Actinomycetota bacterium]
MTADGPPSRLPAAALREVATIWWDVERDPDVTWTDGATFELVDPEGDGRLVLARFGAPVADPRAVAAVLAEGLAACDFPPTGDGASPARVAATLRAAGRPERPVGEA